MAALSLCSTAMAAESVAHLGAVSGQVLVSHGDGFKPAVPGAPLNVGDRVIVKSNGGKAALKYSNGCTISLTPGSLVTLSRATPCKAGLTGGGSLVTFKSDSMTVHRGHVDTFSSVSAVAAVAFMGQELSQRDNDRREIPASP